MKLIERQGEGTRNDCDSDGQSPATLLPRLATRAPSSRRVQRPVRRAQLVVQEENRVAFTVRAKPAREPNVSFTADAS